MLSYNVPKAKVYFMNEATNLIDKNTKLSASEKATVSQWVANEMEGDIKDDKKKVVTRTNKKKLDDGMTETAKYFQNMAKKYDELAELDSENMRISELRGKKEKVKYNRNNKCDNSIWYSKTRGFADHKRRAENRKKSTHGRQRNMYQRLGVSNSSSNMSNDIVSGGSSAMNQTGYMNSSSQMYNQYYNGMQQVNLSKTKPYQYCQYMKKLEQQSKMKDSSGIRAQNEYNDQIRLLEEHNLSFLQQEMYTDPHVLDH